MFFLLKLVIVSFLIPFGFIASMVILGGVTEVIHDFLSGKYGE